METKSYQMRPDSRILGANLGMDLSLQVICTIPEVLHNNALGQSNLNLGAVSRTVETRLSSDDR